MLDYDGRSEPGIEDLLVLVPTLNGIRRAAFLRVYMMLCVEEQRTTQALVYREQCLEWPPTPTSRLALRTCTTPDNIRMARMRARRFMRDNLGGWVDGLAEAIQCRQREQYG